MNKTNSLPVATRDGSVRYLVGGMPVMVRVNKGDVISLTASFQRANGDIVTARLDTGIPQTIVSR
jgi:hypothetical protein